MFSFSAPLTHSVFGWMFFGMGCKHWSLFLWHSEYKFTEPYCIGSARLSVSAGSCLSSAEGSVLGTSSFQSLPVMFPLIVVALGASGQHSQSIVEELMLQKCNFSVEIVSSGHLGLLPKRNNSRCCVLLLWSALLFGGFGSCCIAHRANFLNWEQRVATCYWTSATDFLQHCKERPHALVPSCCIFKYCLPGGHWPHVHLIERPGACLSVLNPTGLHYTLHWLGLWLWGGSVTYVVFEEW